MKFFWFGCPHCFSFEPTINRWDDNKPEYITLVREAPPLNPSWEPHSRAFYAAEALGVKEVMFDEMFNGIHVDRRNLRSPDSITGASLAGGHEGMIRVVTELAAREKELLASVAG